MTEDERQEENEQDQIAESGEEIESDPQDEQPVIVSRPIEMEVNLLRRKLNGVVFLVLVIAVLVLAVVTLLYRTERKRAISLGGELERVTEQRDQLGQQFQGAAQTLDIILKELNAMRATNVEVAKLWNKLRQVMPGLPANPEPGAASGDTVTEAGP